MLGMGRGADPADSVKTQPCHLSASWMTLPVLVMRETTARWDLAKFKLKTFSQHQGLPAVSCPYAAGLRAPRTVVSSSLTELGSCDMPMSNVRL